MNPQYMNDMLTRQRQKYDFRDSNRLIQPRFNTVKYGLKSFRYYGSKLWNALPIDIKKSREYFAFQNADDRVV